jgi:gliotoxin/aspirochlorine biosynthesis thioredoxin reductase
MTAKEINGHSEIYDVLIIGGGPAGLSAATNLARSLHTVVIFDSKEYRNALLPHLHGVPGWDHEDPSSIRTRMQKDLIARYDTAQIVHVPATHAARCDKGSANFCVTDATKREWFGRKLVLATGVSDLLPDLPGYESCWVNGMYGTSEKSTG